MVAQTNTGPAVVQPLDEVQTVVNLAITESIDKSQIAGSCLVIIVSEDTKKHAESIRAKTRAVRQANDGTLLSEGPVQTGERSRFATPCLCNVLLAAGAVCETLETATERSNIHYRA